MKTISMKEFILISIEPVIKSINRWWLNRQIKWIDNHIDFLDKSIANDRSAKSVLQQDRMHLNNRRNSLR